MKIKTEEFRVREGDKIRLKDWPTRVKSFYTSKRGYEELLAAHVDKLRELQSLLYAHNRYALLLVFQGMDTSGKDGVVKHVMSGINPQGCQVYSFKQPSAEELEHDFLWRTTKRLPERGRIGIFNRSYYEEVLVVRVHPEILKGENLPAETLEDPKFWEHRYRSILDQERHLHRNGTRILKFFLHLSREEQRRRFLARIDDGEKNWKFSRSDFEERRFWKDYQRAYEDCLAATSTELAPWFVVPADDKENARLIVSQAIVETLGSLKMSYPKYDKERRRELQEIRRLMTK
jgi:PPK2 family polyphosphate:nucleotide phosphotransferase